MFWACTGLGHERQVYFANVRPAKLRNYVIADTLRDSGVQTYMSCSLSEAYLL